MMNLNGKRNGLQLRMLWSFRNRSKGSESISPDCLYDSILSDGPIAAIDKITRRACLRDLPLGPLFLERDSWNKSKRKSGKDFLTFALTPALTPSRFHIRRGKVGALFGPDELLYLELIEVPWRRASLLKLFADCLVELAKVGILDLGPASHRRSRAIEVLKTVFRLTEVEFRIDLPIRESARIEALLEPYYDPDKGYSVSSWKRRFERGYHLKPYSRPLRRFSFLRVEMIFYFRADAPDFRLPLGSEAALAVLWPRYVANLENLRHYGPRPEMDQLLETLRVWRSLRRRIRNLDLYPADVDAMFEKNQRLPRSLRVF